MRSPGDSPWGSGEKMVKCASLGKLLIEKSSNGGKRTRRDGVGKSRGESVQKREKSQMKQKVVL